MSGPWMESAELAVRAEEAAGYIRSAELLLAKAGELLSPQEPTMPPEAMGIGADIRNLEARATIVLRKVEGLGR